MAKGKTKKQHSKRKFSISLAVVGGMLPGIIDTIGNGKAHGWTVAAQGSPDNALAVFVRDYTGILIDRGPAGVGWSLAAMRQGAMPLLGGIVVHKLANRLGINRAIRQAGIPFISL